VRRAEEALWGDVGRDARAWLRARGLRDDTIERFRLGFVPEGYRTRDLKVLGGKPIYVARGITLPWVHPASWYSKTPEPGVEPPPRWVGVNIRRLRPDVIEKWVGADKCRALKGSTRGYLYPVPDLNPGVPVLIAEGEWDGLIAFQELGHVVDVAAVGSASTTPRPEALETSPLWLLASHNDDAGEKAAETWERLAVGRDRRLLLPGVKDLNEYVERDGDLLSWLRDEFDRLGLRWPLEA
jgi:DNA primase